MEIIDQEKIIHNLENEINLEDYQISTREEENKKLKVVFMGTPSFAVPVLEGLIEQYEVVLVVCQPDRKKDRKGNMVIPDTKAVALKHGIEFFQPIKIRNDYQVILDKEPDLIVTCAYGQIIPKEVIDYPKYGCINVHGSLLPKLRGGAPIHWAIINGETVTGITVMLMSEKMDAGDIICQRSLSIGPDEILDSLYERMSILGRNLLLETIPNIVDGTYQHFPQNEEEVTFGFNIKKEDEKISFDKKCFEVRNLVRGLNSMPGAYCLIDDKRMKVYRVELVNGHYSEAVAGEIVAVLDDGMIVQCADGYIKILEIAMEGKKRCLVRDYFNGVKKDSFVGKVLH